MHYNECEVGIHWNLEELKNVPNYISKLLQIEKLMRELGVSFDTGYGCEEIDWEFDWSLRGPIYVTFKKFVKDNPENRYMEKTN